MLSSLGAEQKINLGFLHFNIKGKSMQPTIKINNKEFNLIKDGLFDFIDISSKFGIEKKIDYIKKKLSDSLILDKHIDGIIISKDSSLEFFNEVRDKYNEVKMVYLNRKIIITRFPCIGHMRATLWFNQHVVNYHRTIQGDGVNVFPEASFRFGVGNSCIVPDSGIIPINRLAPFSDIPTMVFEVSFSKGITAGFEKARLYLNIPGIILVFYIVISKRNSINGTWKGFAFVFNRTIDVQNPTIAISFGTRSSSLRNENKVRNLSNNNSQLTGFLSTNNLSNLIPNNPPFLITTQPNLLFSGVAADQLVLQNQNLIFDLFNLKNQIDALPNFFATLP